MTNTTRGFRPLQLVLFLLALGGCASAVDEGGAQSSSEDATASSSEELKSAAAAKADAALDADAADCDAAPTSARGDTAAYNEYMSVVSNASLSIGTGSLGNTCTNVCKCCKRGNRFCCSHCTFCSGPIGVSGGVLAP